jgi:hypothetical protein
VISALVQTEHYITDPIPSDFEDYYEDSDSLRTPLDIDSF